MTATGTGRKAGGGTPIRTVIAGLLAVCFASAAHAATGYDITAPASITTTRIVPSSTGVVVSWTLPYASGIVHIALSASENGNQQVGWIAWGTSQTGGAQTNYFPVYSPSGTNIYTYDKKFRYAAAPTLYFYVPNLFAGAQFPMQPAFYVEVEASLTDLNGNVNAN